MKLGLFGKIKKRYWVVILVVVMAGVSGYLIANDPIRRLKANPGLAYIAVPKGFAWGGNIPGWPHEVGLVEVEAPFEDDEIELVFGLEKLQVIRFDGVPITGELMSRLQTIEKLKNVLFKTPMRVTQEGLEGVEVLSRSILVGVNSLYIDSSTQITPEGLELLAGITGLNQMHLEGEAIDDAALVTVAKISQLEMLDLQDVPVTNEGLGALVGLSKLMGLGLMDVEVTDGAIEFIERMEGLKVLTLWETGISEAGVARLKESRPNLIVRVIEGAVGDLK